MSSAVFLGGNTSLLWPPGVPLGLAVLAIAQMGVHLVFFLHVTTGPDNTNNVLALAHRNSGSRGLTVDHGRFEREHDAIGPADKSAYAALAGSHSGRVGADLGTAARWPLQTMSYPNIYFRDQRVFPDCILATSRLRSRGGDLRSYASGARPTVVAVRAPQNEQPAYVLGCSRKKRRHECPVSSEFQNRQTAAPVRMRRGGLAR